MDANNALIKERAFMNSEKFHANKEASQSGFTLVELMITVAIVAILASIAIPNYRDYVTRGKLAEAYSTLAALRVSMEQFYQDNRTYVGGPGCTRPALAGDKFTYTCPAAATAVAYTITATGIAAQGTDQFIFTIDQNNARATTGVPTGWTAVNNCWVTAKGGRC
jgi:type IV pilus assembly protein PilE